MSELINNMDKRKQLLKHMILQLHEGKEVDVVRNQLLDMLGQVPYGEVVEVEQELIAEGLPQEEVIKLCDVHSQALKGVVSEDNSLDVPPGHPIHTFVQENRAIQLEIAELEAIHKKIASTKPTELLLQYKQHFNNLMDVDKHYRRKENLLFPFLEKLGITGPPTVMWGKHDEIREQLKAVHEGLSVEGELSKEDLESVVEFLIIPATTALEEMVYKEEKILLPMCAERLTDADWLEIYNASIEIGFCLYDPQEKWQPENIEIQPAEQQVVSDRIQFPSGSFTNEELVSMLNTLPVDMTFVDKDDNVKYFSQGSHRIFDRNRTILNRKVQMCHPPGSVHIVDQILDDFKSGRQSHAPFWINMGGKFIHIEYFAVRNEKGDYLGTLEVSQDLSGYRALEGEQRLLSYETDKE